MTATPEGIQLEIVFMKHYAHGDGAHLAILLIILK